MRDKFPKGTRPEWRIPTAPSCSSHYSTAYSKRVACYQRKGIQNNSAKISESAIAGQADIIDSTVNFAIRLPRFDPIAFVFNFFGSAGSSGCGEINKIDGRQ